MRLRFNAFCPTGPGGGVDSSCSGKSGVHAKIAAKLGRDVSVVAKAPSPLKDEDGKRIGWKVKFRRGANVKAKSATGAEITAKSAVVYDTGEVVFNADFRLGAFV